MMMRSNDDNLKYQQSGLQRIVCPGSRGFSFFYNLRVCANKLEQRSGDSNWRNGEENVWYLKRIDGAFIAAQ